MKVAFFSARSYDTAYFQNNTSPHQFTFIKEKLDAITVKFAESHDAICISAQDIADEPVLKELLSMELNFIVVRASGTDNVDMGMAFNNDITVKWLPGFSPRAIAEHAAALLLALNRKILIASERVKHADFSIEGLMGFNLYQKTVGIIGSGRVGSAFAEIMRGFGCQILINDTKKNINMLHNGIHVVNLSELLQQSDIISLHCSLNDTSEAIINTRTLQSVKPGTILINTARGKLVDTIAVLEALDKGLLGAYGTDVYEHENNFFYQTFESMDDVDDPVLKELIKHPSVLLTSHQAFFTKEAMRQMAQTVINDLTYQENLTGGLSDRLMI
ncbi:MAG: 2-hydroxyacid dehydrogenase [Chitinophagaceae bacterium]|nr:MAG: 2-hydroxyacid dehydrogenase [Chitinophagaceae bacterium]